MHIYQDLRLPSLRPIVLYCWCHLSTLECGDLNTSRIFTLPRFHRIITLLCFIFLIILVLDLCFCVDISSAHGMGPIKPAYKGDINPHSTAKLHQLELASNELSFKIHATAITHTHIITCEGSKKREQFWISAS